MQIHNSTYNAVELIINMEDIPSLHTTGQLEVIVKTARAAELVTVLTKRLQSCPSARSTQQNSITTSQETISAGTYLQSSVQTAPIRFQAVGQSTMPHPVPWPCTQFPPSPPQSMQPADEQFLAPNNDSALRSEGVEFDNGELRTRVTFRNCKVTDERGATVHIPHATEDTMMRAVVTARRLQLGDKLNMEWRHVSMDSVRVSTEAEGWVNLHLILDAIQTVQATGEVFVQMMTPNAVTFLDAVKRHLDPTVAKSE